MKEIEQVSIVGVGLIGGSLGLVFRQHGIRVVGFDKDAESLKRAAALGVIDEGIPQLEKAVSDSDVIIVCTPVRTIRAILEQLSAISLKPGAIVTDTGSTKKELADFAERLRWQNGSYIGAHPMAGSHRSGVEAATSDLFENAYYVLTPSKETPLSTVEKLTKLLKFTRAKIVQMTADEHDRIMAAISHWPHVLAAMLVNQVGEYNKRNGWYHTLAAGGFRDFTRIASSDPKMWRDITLTNRAPILTMLEHWQHELSQFRHMLLNEQEEDLEAFFLGAKRFRDQLPKRARGSLPRVYECYVDVPDHPGSIGKVATLLGNKGISLANIGILENREEVAGVLRLAFYKEADYDRAVSVLKEHGYPVYPAERENGNR